MESLKTRACARARPLGEIKKKNFRDGRKPKGKRRPVLAVFQKLRNSGSESHFGIVPFPRAQTPGDAALAAKSGIFCRWGRCSV